MILIVINPNKFSNTIRNADVSSHEEKPIAIPPIIDINPINTTIKLKILLFLD